MWQQKWLQILTKRYLQLIISTFLVACGSRVLQSRRDTELGNTAGPLLAEIQG